jgi:hypothetical protein
MAANRRECSNRATHSGMKIRCCSSLVASTSSLVSPPRSSRSLLPEFRKIGGVQLSIFLNFINDYLLRSKESLIERSNVPLQGSAQS